MGGAGQVLPVLAAVDAVQFGLTHEPGGPLVVHGLTWLNVPSGKKADRLPVRVTEHSARNRTSGPVLRSGSPRLVIQETLAWLVGTQLVRASEAAAPRSEEAAARALRRKDARPVTGDEEQVLRDLGDRRGLWRASSTAR